jgi:tripartite-type tricarboxylate transporter receptor subunit TctC
MHRNLNYLAATFLLFMATTASAAEWPAQPITIIVPFSAGGPTDFIARLVAEPLSKELGKTVVVQNQAGASGNVGYKNVLSQPADGYTLLHNTVGMQVINPLMYPDANLQPAQDYVTVGVTGAMPNVLVINPKKNPVTNLASLIERGRQAPQSLSYANYGPGSSPHVYGALLQRLARFEAVSVPYRGSANAMTDVMGGQVDFLFDNISTSLSQIQSGRLTALAITSPNRSPLLPDVPTLKEAGYASLDLKFWFSLQAPAGTPPDVIARLQQAVSKVVQSDAYRKALEDRGAEALPVTPKEIKQFVQAETVSWTKAVQSIGLKPE